MMKLLQDMTMEAPSETSASKNLRDALQLAYDEPAVADWLFSNKDAAYVDNIVHLSPGAFKQSVVFRIYHHIDRPQQPVSPDSLNGFEPLFSSQEPGGLEGAADLILTPACNVGTVLLGYCMSLPLRISPYVMSILPFPKALFDHSHVNGRFAFDTSTRRLTCVMNAVSPTITALISMCMRSPQRRDRLIFTVENRQYTFSDLPIRPLAVLSNIEYDVSKFDVSPQRSDVASSFFDWLCHQSLDGLNLPSEPILSDDMKVATIPSTSFAETSFESQTTTHTSETDVVNQLHNLFLGNYDTGYAQRQEIDPSTGKITNQRVVQQLCANHVPTRAQRRAVLIEYAATCYYSVSIALATGRMIARAHCAPLGITPPTRPTLSTDGSTDETNASCSENAAQTIKSRVPRIVPAVQVANLPSALPPALPPVIPKVVLQDDQQGITKLELKRRRNRMAAARSNVKRKLREEQQIKELEGLKSRVSELREVQCRLQEENQILKTMSEAF